jgi:hypothetical protein
MLFWETLPGKIWFFIFLGAKCSFPSWAAQWAGLLRGIEILEYEKRTSCKEPHALLDRFILKCIP